MFSLESAYGYLLTPCIRILVMVGGTLPPFKLLVDHLSSQWSSIHPIVEMYKADVEMLDVRSNFSFSELPVSRSNIWLMDLLSFQPSTRPLNDIMIIYIDSIYGSRKLKDPASSTNMDKSNLVVPRSERITLDAIGFITTLMLCVGLACSILMGDLWASVLFFFYSFHSLTSAAVSFVPMISTSDSFGRNVSKDSTTRFAVYSRASGGKVVFVGQQDALESWARTTWTYQKTSTKNLLHWCWMITGSLAAAASVICMVNMAGALQLAYLGTLVISSFGDLLVTRLVRKIQSIAIHYGDCYMVGDSDYWSQSIIRAGLETEERFCLASLPWCEFGLVPDTPLFRNLGVVLEELRAPGGASLSEADVESKLSDGVSGRHRHLAHRFAVEIQAARDGKSFKPVFKLFS